MYRAIQNKKYYLAVNTFKKAAKNQPFNYAYTNGFKKWEADSGTNYALVIGTLRIIFEIKKEQLACCK